MSVDININQSEICFDIPTASKEEVREIIFNWSARNMRIFDYSSLYQKHGTLQIITHFLKMIGEVEFLVSEMEKTIVRTFGIGGIITVDKQKIGLTREIEKIQSYNSP
jgi:hypothetical protein